MPLFSPSIHFKSLFKKKAPKVKTNALIYAVGDVHGRNDLLARLLAEIRKDVAGLTRADFEKVIIVFLGDYIDRGHSSKEVIDTLCSLKLGNAEIVCLKGNHEAALLGFVERASAGLNWAVFGGRETMASYGIDMPNDLKAIEDWELYRQALIKKISAKHLSFLRGLKSYKIEGQYMFVHAGVHPGRPPEAQTDAEYLWIRNKFLNSMKKLPYIIVHGHTPEEYPIWDGRRIGVDTGAYMSNKLTAVRLINGEVSFLST